MSRTIDMRPWADGCVLWLVWPEDETEDEARRVRARDPREAAEDYAAYSDSGGDYCILNGNDATVHVRRDGGIPVDTFVVHGESVPSYSARRKR